MSTSNTQSPALQHVLHMWDNLAYKSHRNVNHVMHVTLRTAIEAGLKFHPGDMGIIASKCRGSYWMHLEGLYGIACGEGRGTENTSAAKSCEAFFDRPAWLWPDKTRTPERLHVGAWFLWQGCRVKVTSFKDPDSLIACSYKEGSRDEIEKRFTITYEALMKVRKDADAARRVHEKAIKGANTLEELEAVKHPINHNSVLVSLRHFDIEILNELIHKRRREIETGIEAKKQTNEGAKRAKEHREWLKKEAQRLETDLPRWLAGEPVTVPHGAPIQCRVVGNVVEVTNGQRVPLAAARQALAHVLARRAQCETAVPAECDGHPISKVDQEGITIGCTRLAWSEVDRIAPLIQAA